MTLDEAIKHCNEVACKHDKCAMEHKQLAQWLIELKGYKEQKLTNKVEPKFEIKKGRWYVCDTPRYTDFIVGKAYYCPKNGMLKPNENEMARYVARDCFHLWTIQDAKNGEMLAYPDGSLTIFYYRLSGLDTGLYMSHILLTDKIELKQTCAINNVHPATKEQRDLLFRKMKEAGYEWDAEKKELKKDKQMPAEIKKLAKGNKRENPISVWSEEDERYINIAVSAFSSPSLERLYHYNKVKSNDLINWLKSLKDKILHQKQWKLSDEQLKALKEACDEHWESDGLDPLYTLCEQLKKLREE